MSILVTGGGGFIGSNLVSQLMANGKEIHVIDNRRTEKILSFEALKKNDQLKFHQIDLLEKESLLIPKDCKTIFHLAANPEVRIGATNPEVHFSQNVVATFNILEAARKNDAEAFIFTSSSTVYGDAATTPTPEDYSPMEPISIYGASKLACESIISSYAHTYGIRAVIYRLANIIGEDSTHGVIFDFINKLTHNSSELEVLGDGTQNKSYLHVSDCIAAILLGTSSTNGRVNIFNVGSKDQIIVRDIASIVIDEMKLADTRMQFTGGVDNGRGWKGDIKNMLLDITKIESIGWKPSYNSAEAVRLTTKRMIPNLVYSR